MLVSSQTLSMLILTDSRQTDIHSTMPLLQHNVAGSFLQAPLYMYNRHGQLRLMLLSFAAATADVAACHRMQPPCAEHCAGCMYESTFTCMCQPLHA